MKSTEWSLLVERLDAALTSRPISSIAMHSKLDLPMHRLEAVSQGLSLLHSTGRANREWKSSFGIGRFFYWKGTVNE